MRFLSLFCVLVCSGVLATFTLGYIVNPFGIWNTALFPATQFHRIDPRDLQPLLMIKAAEKSADYIIIGSSRAREMYNPNSIKTLRGYNAGFSGATTFEKGRMMSLLARADYRGTVIVGIDFFSSAPGSTLRGVARNGPLDNQPVWAARLESTWGWDALIAAGKTLRSMLKPEHTEKELNFFGAYQPGNHAARFKDGLQGHAADFIPRFNPAHPAPDVAHMTALREGAELLLKNGAHVKFVINPVHASRLLLDQQSGLENHYTQFIQALIDMAGDLNQAYPDHIELWDFAYCGDILAEPIPTDPSKSMVYFFDANHATPILGQIILRRVLKNQITEHIEGILLAPTKPKIISFHRDWRLCQRRIDPVASDLLRNIEEIREKEPHTVSK